MKAVDNINGPISKAILNFNCEDQIKIDETLISLDGTEQKKKIGANAILAVSMASCKLAASEKKISLFRHIGNSKKYQLPVPLLNIINGGVHANNNLDIQEFMIRPEKTISFSEAMRKSYLVIQNLKKMVDNTNVGDEGGFAPNLKSAEEAIKLIIRAIEKSGLKPESDISICLDVAANELKKPMSIDSFLELAKKYPIKSIEDPFKEDEWESWKKLTSNTNIQIVGTICLLLILKIKKRDKEKSANAILVKLNQMGTVSETMDVIKLAHDNNFKTLFLIDLALRGYFYCRSGSCDKFVSNKNWIFSEI